MADTCRGCVYYRPLSGGGAYIMLPLRSGQREAERLPRRKLREKTNIGGSYEKINKRR